MLNNYFKPSVTRPTTYSPYFTHKPASDKAIKPINQQKNRKYKLFIILIAKAVRRQLRNSWEQMWAFQRNALQSITKMVNHCQKNLSYTWFFYFDKLKRAAALNKSAEKLFKNTVILLQRMQKYKLKQAFSKLLLNSVRHSDGAISRIFEKRSSQFQRKIYRMIKGRKKDTFDSIRRYSKFVKSYSKVRVIAVIHNRFQRHLKHLVFAQLSRFLIASSSRTYVDREMKDLKTQLQDMTVQLENKNQNIQRLEDQLNQIKVQQSSVSIHHNLSYGEPPLPRTKNGSFKSYSMKKLANNSYQKLSHNESGDNISINDMSIGSLLGNLNRSRAGSNSKFDPNYDCSCGFKTKYVKYKSLNESLKNQLEIVKQQLEVAKDLNEHFTNEIKSYLTGQIGDGEFEKLKKDHKMLMDERDQLREKVFKYQKHISNLKAEFKIKMQELYRKVRKEM